MLDWTGHALVDVGIAALCAMRDKDNPVQLTFGELDAAAKEMEKYYFGGALNSYLTCVFMNSEYVQPGTGRKKDESRRRYANRILWAHRAEPEPSAKGETCVFSGLPATHRIHRGQMPLLTGEGVLNFFPAAAGGLFIAGPYLTALQALPLGGRRSEGKLLIAHSDSPALTLAMASSFVEDNRRLLALAMSVGLPNTEGPDESLLREQASYDRAKKRPKYPDSKAAFTLIGSDLLGVLRLRRDAQDDHAPTAGLDVYWLSSSGQGPSLKFFSVPSHLIRFLALVTRASTSTAWERTIMRGWAGESTKASASRTGILTGPGRSKNAVLEDLFAIYEYGFIDKPSAHRFVRRHLFSDLRSNAASAEDCCWDLTAVFLKEVFLMSPERVQRIREFADALAAYIETRNDSSLYRRLTYAKYFWEFRAGLVKAQRASVKTDLLFSFEDYLRVFEAEDSTGVTDWSLVRDLICIRTVEQLYKSGWLTPERVNEEDAEQEQTA